MTALDTALASLVRHHVATPAQPLLEPAPPITWLWAANGVFKRGVSPHLDALIRVGATTEAPGLASLLPHVRWPGVRGRIPGALLVPILDHARRMGQGNGVQQPIEQQYFIVRDDSRMCVRVPPQRSSATRIRYTMAIGTGVLLLDIHSHHRMPAYFSSTDDTDDQGLSVSCVLGTIFTAPTIICRVNVHGHRQHVPALTLFDALPGIEDTHADIDH
jgi:PRTRC genetic system protein A